MLRMRPLGEADRIVTLFSRERGKLSAVAKGVRKTRSKFGARLDFFSRVSLMLHEGKSLDVITSVQIVRAIWEKLVDPDTFALASYVAETIDALCETDFAVPDLYDTLCEFQNALARPGDRDLLLAAVDLRMLGALGFTPELEACARCGATLGARPLSGGRAWLSPEAGGLVCNACVRQMREAHETFDRVHGAFSVGAKEFTALRALGGVPFDNLGASGKGTPLHRATRAFIENHMGRRSRALTVVGAGTKFERSAARKA